MDLFSFSFFYSLLKIGGALFFISVVISILFGGIKWAIRFKFLGMLYDKYANKFLSKVEKEKREEFKEYSRSEIAGLYGLRKLEESDVLWQIRRQKYQMKRK